MRMKVVEGEEKEMVEIGGGEGVVVQELEEEKEAVEREGGEGGGRRGGGGGGGSSACELTVVWFLQGHVLVHRQGPVPPTDGADRRGHQAEPHQGGRRC